MIGILILGLMECVHGIGRPLKITAKNHQELLLLLNLQALFAVSLYTTSNSIAVNTLVGIAMVQFVIFLLSQNTLCRKITKAAMNKGALLTIELANQIWKSKAPQGTELNNGSMEFEKKCSKLQEF